MWATYDLHGLQQFGGKTRGAGNKTKAPVKAHYLPLDEVLKLHHETINRLGGNWKLLEHFVKTLPEKNHVPPQFHQCIALDHLHTWTKY